jgi:hypothetical protein
MKNEIILYRPNELAEHIEVRIDDETVWLNRQQIAILFGRDVKTIGKHVNNIFLDEELVRELVVANFATTTQYGAIKGKTETINKEDVCNKRAEYEKQIIRSIAKQLTEKYGSGWSNRKLLHCIRTAYTFTEDQIVYAMRTQLTFNHNEYLI